MDTDRLCDRLLMWQWLAVATRDGQLAHVRCTEDGCGQLLPPSLAKPLIPADLQGTFSALLQTTFLSQHSDTACQVKSLLLRTEGFQGCCRRQSCLGL